MALFRFFFRLVRRKFIVFILGCFLENWCVYLRSELSYTTQNLFFFLLISHFVCFWLPFQILWIRRGSTSLCNSIIFVRPTSPHLDFLSLSQSKHLCLIDKLAFSGTIFILSSKNQLYCDSVAFPGLRVAFNPHVELLQIRSSNFTKISLFHSGPIYFQMLRPVKKKTLLCHAKFISLYFELKFGIFFVAVMKPIKKARANYEFWTHYFG